MGIFPFRYTAYQTHRCRRCDVRADSLLSRPTSQLISTFYDSAFTSSCLVFRWTANLFTIFKCIWQFECSVCIVVCIYGTCNQTIYIRIKYPFCLLSGQKQIIDLKFCRKNVTAPLAGNSIHPRCFPEHLVADDIFLRCCYNTANYLLILKKGKLHYIFGKQTARA